MQLPCAICTPTAWLHRKRPVLMRLGPEWHSVARQDAVQCGGTLWSTLGCGTMWYSMTWSSTTWCGRAHHGMIESNVV